MFKILIKGHNSSFKGNEEDPRLGALTYLGPSSWPDRWDFEIPANYVCVEGLEVDIYSVDFILFHFISFHFIIFFGHAARHVGSWFPNQGLNLSPLQWKLRVLTTGPPGKSHTL